MNPDIPEEDKEMGSSEDSQADSSSGDEGPKSRESTVEGNESTSEDRFVDQLAKAHKEEIMERKWEAKRRSKSRVKIIDEAHVLQKIQREYGFEIYA